MSNYPDDIRQYDNDPRSPFYKEPTECDELEDESENWGTADEQD